ncbi:hypothetical protein J32TS6_02190 [Virgibacillus pantothenticus]|uniref:Uncharacterized protein n=1 Tax=Virgibacillus pantothenticus TaxID=1473 RepID=A0A0L0QPI5_VIRPA|nr:MULTISPECIES: SA1362 family protein [Virgibacillus]API90517.1 hypothetical protein BKP57_00760 [Virgibacillus sp. 6R]KNE20476.1 hypothetical protein AFK71_19090 [Virgibacillus pantothenticus]MBS7429626.1 hypothetical protein [Virgibacillus sp. 19R1-5]MBU8565501.1 hypothetical protein [Virgibacillus pantothenticus]MBU8599801.1 hypothetical protein [Virgibacillus pantothenticus]
MKRKSISIPVYMIIGLAVIGLTTQLFTNTVSFINSMLISIGVGVVLFTIIYFLFIRKKNSSNEMKKYKQAVKQSKAKYHHQKPVHKATAAKEQPSNALRKKRNKRAAHLRVIDGNKHKRKDRASF